MLDSELTALTEAEAIAKIMAGEPLKGCVIPKLELQDKEIPGPISLQECRVGLFSLVNTTIQGQACFDRTVFLDRVIAGWDSPHHKTGVTTFQSAVSFNNCIFQGKALFGGAQFQTISSFKQTLFQKEAVFQEARFQEQVYFWHTQFTADANFRNAVFGIEGHFDYAKFLQNVNFESAQFIEKEASFNFIEVYGTMNFLEACFKGYLAFRKSMVHGEVDFKRSKIEGEADFQDTHFKSKISFRNSLILSKISFLHTIFHGLASFLCTQFQEANFLNAQFHDEALFNYDRNTRASLNEAGTAAHFAGCADFTNVRFVKRAVFEEIVFEKSATFANSYFGEQASFIDAKFQGPASFNNVYCNQELSAINATFTEITLDHANINRRLDLSDAKFNSISFYKASLDLIVVERSQIRQKLIHERPNTPQYSRVQEEYLILKESFQQRGLSSEEDWAYRKFRQMKRKARTQQAWARILRKTKEGGFIRSWARLIANFLERIIVDRGTGYGTQPLNITIVAFSIILLFGYVYSQFPEEFHLPQGVTLNFSEAVYYSIATFTTMGLNDIQPKLDSVFCYLSSMEAFLGIFIMTLFVGIYTRKIIR